LGCSAQPIPRWPRGPPRTGRFPRKRCNRCWIRQGCDDNRQLDITKALAATDPDRAARLITDAERAAQSITNEQAKASAQAAVAEVMAATDHDRAERIARSITDGYFKT
jgi:hypothetical protein